MRIRWTEPAARDLTQICDYIQEHDSGNTARRIALSIYERVSALIEFPERGRQGRIKETRELILYRPAVSCRLSRSRARCGDTAHSSRCAGLAQVDSGQPGGKLFWEERRCAN
ncbi:MAG: type II toxin-antitoxin system RelE/ParE family toxin [Candidatus Acidiferrum sp.]